MNALNSYAVWGGLAAVGVAVPIIIHLLYRKHRKQTNWAAMELLRRALVMRSGQVKMEDYLILALRCLALLLIAFALLRPTISSEKAKWLGEKRVGMVVAMDASFSMNHGEHSRYEKALARTREILANAKTGHPVSLMLMSSQPDVLLRGSSYDEAKVDKALEGRQQATHYRLDLLRNLEKLHTLVDELDAASREVYLITDAQQLDWASLSGKASEALKDLTRKASVFVVPVATEGEENLSITQLRYVSGSLQKSGVARFNAQVKNEGQRKRDGGNVEFYVQDELISRRAVGPLEAGQEKAVSFFASFDSPGDIRLKAQLAGDALDDDNDRFAVVNVRPELRVLCVDDGAGDEENDRGGAYYATHALRLMSREDSDGPLQVNRIVSADLSLESLANFDVIILANVADVAPEMVVRLKRFAKNGGGLIFFLGDRVDPELYNKRFGTDEDGLLPAQLVTTTSAKEGKSWSLGNLKSDHSLAAVAKRLPAGLLDTARFYTVMQTVPSPGSETVLKVAEPDLPLVVARGSVLLVTSSADRSWNELAVHPLYVMMMQQAITTLTSPTDKEATVGEPAQLVVPGVEVGDQLKLEDPQGKQTSIKVTQVGHRPACAIETQSMGVYATQAEGEVPAVALAVNVDATESNVRVMDGGALAGWFELAGVTAFGFVVLAIVSAAIGYLMASLIWRLMVARKRTKRLRDMAQRVDPLNGEAVGSEPTQGEA